MSSMIERVAESQAKFDGRSLQSMPRGERQRYMDRARAAIEAMREPTDEMVTAVMSRGVIDYAAIGDWGKMIYAALKDGSDEPQT